MSIVEQAEDGYIIQPGDWVEMCYCGTLIWRKRITRVTAKTCFLRSNDVHEHRAPRIYSRFDWHLGAYDRGCSYRVIPAKRNSES